MTKGTITETGYLTTSGAAAILQVSPKTVARWVKEGKLPHRKTLGGHARFNETEIRALYESLREEARG